MPPQLLALLRVLIFQRIDRVEGPRKAGTLGLPELTLRVGVGAPAAMAPPWGFCPL